MKFLIIFIYLFILNLHLRANDSGAIIVEKSIKLKTIELKNNQFIDIKINSGKIIERIMASNSGTLVTFSDGAHIKHGVHVFDVFSTSIKKGTFDGFIYSYIDKNGILWQCNYSKNGSLLLKIGYKNGKNIGAFVSGVFIAPK